jgi:hypothetical protein
MAIIKYLWKVWLRLNFLTKDVENDYNAEVSTIGYTLYNADIARDIKLAGSDLQEETINDVLERADRIRKQKLLEGYSIQTGVCHISPRVQGSWHGTTAVYDPTKHHITFDMHATSELHAEAASVHVEVIGVKDSGADIGLVIDATTGKSDGAITSGKTVRILGHKIRVAGDDPTVGVWFTATGGGEPVKVTTIVINKPKELIVECPALAAGSYTLTVVTMFTTGKTLLKEPRTIEYALPLTVVV